MRTPMNFGSSPATAATTPGRARAAEASTPVTMAWAKGLRTKAACSIPGSTMSLT